MPLTAIEEVLCTSLNRNVVYERGDGTFDLTYPGRYTETVVRGAAEGCPLTLPPQARDVANFAVCQECLFGVVKPEIG